MLQSIRERFTGLIAVLIVGAIGVALTITLVDTGTLTDTTNFAARVNGEEIPLVDYRQILQQQLMQEEEVARGELPQAAREQIEHNVLEGMVRNRVVAQYVRDKGYRVGDDKLTEHIRSFPRFQVGGKFSLDAFLAVLASEGKSKTAFDEERRAALQIEQLQNGLLESSFFTPAEYRRFVVVAGERRGGAYTVLDPQQVIPGITFTEADLKAYFDAHPDQFESQESVGLDYVEARLADMGQATEPTEAELRAAYEANADRFRTTEQRRGRHILVAIDQSTDDTKALKLAAELRERLGRGEDFGALARQYSSDQGSASSGGDLPWAGKGTYGEPFEAILFAQKVGEISDPVKTEFGYHIIQLQEVRPGAQRSFEDVRGELAQDARLKGSQERYFALTEDMDDAALENPGSLDAVAKATGLPVKHIDQFTRAGGEPFGANRAVIDAAFSGAVLSDGENSPLVEVADGQAVILRVTEHRPVRLRSMDEVRSDVEKAVRAERAGQIVAERGRQMVEKARSGADLAKLAADFGMTVVTLQPVPRTSTTVPPEILTALFRAPAPPSGKPVVDSVALQSGGYAVYRVNEVIPGRPEDIPREQRDAGKGMLAQQIGVAEVTALALDLRKSARVVEAPGLFEQGDDL